MAQLASDIIRFQPNIHTEKQGPNWGKESSESHILKTIPAHYHERYQNTLIAERWMTSDDRKYPSLAHTAEGYVSFAELLQMHGEEILGKKHMEQYGPYLGVVMKLLDTNTQKEKGALSVQVHPKPGHPSRPPKPEMWKGTGNVYFGWNRNMSPESITEAIQTGTLEQCMNIVELKETDLLLVQGGTVHAIRANTYLKEWSMAPGREEISKGNIQDATIALYDRTDGKQMRPNKENLEGSLEVLEHADAFRSTNPEDCMSIPLTIVEAGGEKRTIFSTEEVCVHEYYVQSSMSLSLKERGLPLYVEKGTVEVFAQGVSLGKIHAGDEVFVPAHLEEITLFTASGSTLYSWYKPSN